MKSLNSNVRRPREAKRKRDYNESKDDDIRTDKHLKIADYQDITPQDSNLTLDANNADDTAGFLDEYCQILLKDSTSSQGQDDVELETDILVEKTQPIFVGIAGDQQRVPLSVKLKNWAIKHEICLKHEVIDELLLILRDEGYLDLPCSADAMLGDEICQLNDTVMSKKKDCDEFGNCTVWIKKEEPNESLWTSDDNNSSDHPSHDEIELSDRDKNTETSAICPDFAVGDFMTEESNSGNEKAKTSSNSDKETELTAELKNSNLYSAVRGELEKMEERWARQLESAKRSLLYDMVRKYEDLKTRIGVTNRPLGTSFTDDKEILGIKLPFTNVDSFREFDESIADNPEKEIAMKSLMTTLCFGAATLSNSIGCILSAFLTKDLQMQYSACGKKIRGIKKRNFGDTNTFIYVKDVLREKHGTSDAAIVSKTSRWFTGAGDRDGGRKERKK